MKPETCRKWSNDEAGSDAKPDSLCKLCWGAKQLREDISSSGSSSTDGGEQASARPESRADGTSAPQLEDTSESDDGFTKLWDLVCLNSTCFDSLIGACLHELLMISIDA